VGSQPDLRHGLHYDWIPSVLSHKALIQLSTGQTEENNTSVDRHVTYWNWSSNSWIRALEQYVTGERKKTCRGRRLFVRMRHRPKIGCSTSISASSAASWWNMFQELCNRGSCSSNSAPVASSIRVSAGVSPLQ
jgi:hypothetical protein